MDQRMSINDSDLIARGATADVYAWGGDRVLKLFQPDFSNEVIEREFNNASRIARAGVRTPNAYEMLSVDGRSGIVYQRVYGEMVDTMLQRNILRGPLYMRQMADTLAGLHRARVDVDLRPLPEVCAARIQRAPYLSDEVKARLIAHLHKLPAGDSVVHADYHYRNVLISSEGAVVIDWPDALRGNPLMDLARSYVIFSEDRRDELPNPLMRRLYPLVMTRLRDTFVRHYLRLTGSNWADVQPWLPLMAAARLNESSAQHQQLLAMLDGWLDEFSI